MSDLRRLPRVALVVALFVTIPTSRAEEPVYPGESWQTKSPKEAGLDPAKLRALSKFVGGRGCVIRHGYLVYSWGDISKRADIASAAKPFYAHFLWKALEDGKIPSLDERLVKWEPRLAKINAKLDHKDKAICWRDCANQTSCYQLVEKPGSAYAYNDWQMALFWDTLFLKVYGATYDTVDAKVFAPLLTTPLQCQDKPTMLAFGKKNRAGRVGISVRDFARFGLLYLRKGKWRDKQLLARKYAVQAVTDPLPNAIPRAGRKKAEMIPGQRSHGSRSSPDNQNDHFGSYSWLWWVNGIDRDGTRMFPDAPHDLFGAFGHGGPRAVWGIPSLDIVVSYNDAKMRKWTSGKKNPTNTAMKLLVESVTPTDEPPCDEIDEPRCSKWSPHELVFDGPKSKALGKPNPFDIRLDVTFVSPKGKRFIVPGFYSGDGKGGTDGQVWKVRFSPDVVGRWKYSTKSTHPKLDKQTGSFQVDPTPANAKGYWNWGRLESVATKENGIRYLKFRDGPYWLQAGCDDPENFLGRYKNFGTLAQRKEAIRYLASKGINSMYIMTHNIGGDDNDVWPWIGRNAREAKNNAKQGNVRFDIRKLDEWRTLFEYMQSEGVVPYLILEDDSAWNGYDHDRYHREIIARFGDLPALLFNLGEEHNENYKLRDGLALAKRFSNADPYNHPLAIHNVNKPKDEYIDSPDMDMTAIQTGSPGSRKGLEHALQHNKIVIAWLTKCKQRDKRQLTVKFDEGRPELDRRAWWSAYLGGAVWEAHVLQPYNRPLSTWGRTWTELGGTRRFMESIPFWEMTPNNALVTGGRALCLAKAGEVYALYLPVGGRIELVLPEDAEYRVDWWNPAQGFGGKFSNSSTSAGGKVTLEAPGKGDWALRVRRIGK